jgi:hypothetical protein
MRGVASSTRRRLLGLTAGLVAAGGMCALGFPIPAGAAGLPEQRGAAAAPARAGPIQGVSRQSDGTVVVSPLEAMLRAIPDAPEHRRDLTLNDVERLARIIGAQPPTGSADEAAVLDYIRALFDAGMVTGPFISGLDEFAREGVSRREYLAFGVGDIRQTALAGVPPSRTELIRGQFDPSATEAALAACAECPPPSRESHQGVQFYAWGEDYRQSIRDRFKPPAFDALGRGGRIAVQSEQIYRTLSTEDMQAAIETSLGLRPSLADVESHRLLVAGLAGLGVYSLFLTGDTSSQFKRPRTGATDDPFERATDPSLLLRPYEAVALGTGRDDAGQYLTVGLFHTTPELAAENVEILPRRVDQVPSLRTGQPWSVLFGEVEARAEGAVLVARIRQHSGNPGIWFGWWSNDDSLLYYN